MNFRGGGAGAAGSDSEDDLYSGYKRKEDEALDYETLAADPNFQQAVKSSYGQRPTGTAAGLARRGSLKSMAGGRIPTTGQQPQGGGVGVGGQQGQPLMDPDEKRPMTSVKAAGFTSQPQSSFDQPGVLAGVATFEKKREDTPEQIIKGLEKKTGALIEESAFAYARSDFTLALEKAKEAGKKERHLCKQREQAGLGDQINLDLTYCVLFNLANMYHANQMYAEAQNTYNVIVKNKLFNNAGRLRVNMGNIYFEQKKYPQAIKMYRMALDQIPNTHGEMRFKIMRNIGNAFARMGQYQDAISSFEVIMEGNPDTTTGFNLILCYFALGDKGNMKKSFQLLLTMIHGSDDEGNFFSGFDDTQDALVKEAIKDDELRKMEKEKKKAAENNIITAAKLIAPAIEKDFAAGFDWCVEQVKTSLYTELASELEITKAITYLKLKDFKQAIETFKAFERKDTQMASAAATNLSFLYFLENDLEQANRYADIAIQSDRYNANALVNKGNCLFCQGNYQKAKEYYQDARNFEASCTEALYNLGLLYKKTGDYDSALECFNKLHAILRNSSQVIYQIAVMYDMKGDAVQAQEWFNILISLVPTDPGVLSELGEMFDREGDKSQAYQYHFESYRYFPANIDVISWLGAYYVECEVYEQAIQYFERAATVQPSEVKWQLMVASCHRRSGNYQQAFETYKKIHNKFPHNIECLKFLVRICTDLGMKEVSDYVAKLRKAEKQREVKSTRIPSGGKGERIRSGSRRQGSAGSDYRSQENLDKSLNSSINLHGEYKPAQKKVDASYSDPIGDIPQRPKTAMRKQVDDEDWGDEELGDDLLPQ
eukprot:Nk52_evm49s32 gene=Nk52_evmTU49s32